MTHEDKHAIARDKKYLKERYGMKVSGRSTKTLLIVLMGNKRKPKNKGKKKCR